MLIALLTAVTGCATPPGQLTDSDFVIKKYTVETSVTESASNLYEGLRYCGPHSNGTHHGVPECAPTKKDGSVICDLYIGGGYGGRSDLVLGRIDLIPNNTGTTVELRAQTFAANIDDIFNSWMKFIDNNAGEACQKPPEQDPAEL